MKTFQRILAVVLCLVMSLSVLGTVAFAADGGGENETTTLVPTIDTSKKGSITVHKYEKGTGETGTGTGEETTVTGHEPLADVTFELYQVMTQEQMLAYYNGTDASSVTVDRFVAKNADGSYTVKNYSDIEVGALETLTTDSTGVVVFDGIYDDATKVDDETKTDTENGKSLPLGMYVIIETSAPEKVTVAEKPFLVSVPMTKSTTDADWLYDINVYPKNSTSEGNVTLKKTDKSGTALSGVEFTLEKKNGEVWEKVEETEDDTTFTTNDSGEIAWTSLAYGDYRITETKTLDGYILDQRPICFTVTQSNTITCTDTRACINVTGSGEKALTITLVNEKPDTDKTLADGSEDANAAIGSTVSYKVTVDVPKNITDLKTFTLTDTPTNLNVTNNTIAIKYIDANDTERTLGTSAYSVSEDDKDGTIVNGFTITFTTSQMSAVAGKQIVVTYDAVVLASAATTGKAPNTIDLTYSNKIHPDSSTPDGDGDKNHIKDSAIVYTYKIDVTKYKDSAAAGKELGAVEFELYKGSATTPLSVVKVSDGNYRLAVAGETDTTTTLVTGIGTENDTSTKGKLVVTGLDSGTYYLKETKTADGYNLLKDKVTVNLNLDTATNWTTSSEFVENSNGGWDLVKETYESTTYKNGAETVSDNYVSTTIINKKGFDLPTTGGIGTLMFFIIGGVLIAGGICLITVPNKKRSV